ncbi:DUF4349 domain-containing protein [Longimicrobium sp.]|uniref:DUF4349 domain-containing protein n=1 Tax=Longimicrobium sp. TaxID=2029185 RepID=UPI002CF73704|nr:DUF4349 domain-containing protein [Longimicrobium sp.]HSU17028.1 DUF4349 domain-containing protein [Longimicrobium sp.]
MTMRRFAISLTLLAPLAAAACGRDSGDRGVYEGGASAAPTTAAPATAPKPDAITNGLEQGAVSADSTPVAPTAPPGQSGSDTASAAAATPMIIRTGQATVRVDSLEPAIARVQRLAAQLGGYVANTSVQSGSENAREATLELKIPSARWDAALNGLKPVGRLESQQTSTQDVGEEYVDVTARMQNARRLEERLVSLLATRTGKLEDVLAVERELARVREEIERYEGRLRFLRARVSMSTLSVVLHERYPVLSPGRNPILSAFAEAWRNFVGFLAGFIAMLGWLLPLALVFAAIGWLLAKLLRRLRRNRPPRDPRAGSFQHGPPAPPPPGPPAGPPPNPTPPNPPAA